MVNALMECQARNLPICRSTRGARLIARYRLVRSNAHAGDGRLLAGEGAAVEACAIGRNGGCFAIDDCL